MGKEEIKDTEEKLKQREKELREAEIEFNGAKSRLKSAQENLEWAKKSPLEKARHLAIQHLENAMKERKEIGQETFKLVINALKEDPPESKMALVLDELLRPLTSEGKE